ncbi:Metallo-dependent hydrolase [Lophiostoma macrostomum CBS 122681]|uniref:Metallo-dependent hydrolase n=1 Tax=Lophiostoma macrostomum CBS 122681 TaxID=1314788 RepID=A0A6A6TS27_9PLEO|nr:Metallo-dependent hydrolase [Lophiostoma macrostomum CBS 122681]
MSSILLKNGLVLLHDDNDHVVPTLTSILIEDDKIVKIAKDLAPGASTEVVDCTDKIISPGFIDTHHHGWQTQLKGRHANELLMDYMISGNAQSCQYTAVDTFYGQIAGMLEALTVGTTTLVDHAHVTMSPDHAKLAIAATATSGIRAVYCYTPIMRVKDFNPLSYYDNPLEDWVMQTFSELASQGPFGNGRVSLGFAWDFWFLPPEAIKDVFAKVKEADVKIWTTHHVPRPQFGGGWPGGLLQILKAQGLLDERALISHATGSSKADMDLIREAGAHVSSTPSTEMQMTHGRVVCFDAGFLDGGPTGNEAGIQDNASLGVDCHSNNSASIVAEARLGLQTARLMYNEHYIKQGKSTHGLPKSLSVEAAFNLATIKGAEAVRMESEIGRIAEGYKADLVIFDALSPSMLAAAQHDAVAAIVLHSSPADIETVIVDGIVRTDHGQLSVLEVDEAAREAIGKETLDWSDVASEVLRSRERMQKKMEQIDLRAGKSALLKSFGIDEAIFLDP